MTPSMVQQTSFSVAHCRAATCSQSSRVSRLIRCPTVMRRTSAFKCHAFLAIAWASARKPMEPARLAAAAL
eukprot:443345-Pyramimonas_sp.AAC.1